MEENIYLIVSGIALVVFYFTLFAISGFKWSEFKEIFNFKNK